MIDAKLDALEDLLGLIGTKNLRFATACVLRGLSAEIRTLLVQEQTRCSGFTAHVRTHVEYVTAAGGVVVGELQSIAAACEETSRMRVELWARLDSRVRLLERRAL